jgi:hypothetical protein
MIPEDGYSNPSYIAGTAAAAWMGEPVSKFTVAGGFSPGIAAIYTFTSAS